MLRVFTDERCLLHAAPPGYPEHPDRLRAVLDRVRATHSALTGSPANLGPHRHAETAVEAVHSPAYVARFERAGERGDGLLDSADNPLSAGTWAAAWGAVSATLHAADWVLATPGPRLGFAAVRPPGHHAEADRAMGFCFFNNAAVAAQYLRRCGLSRVAVCDIDVHHGNGTQHIFERRDDVFYASMHQYPFYPGTGAAGERGEGAGEGFTVNVPLAAGSGDDEHVAALQDRLLPALAQFRPGALVVSAGFDSWRGDPLGGMRVSADGFLEWGRRLGELAAESCGGKVVVVLEGGYDIEALGGLVSSHLAGLLAGLSSGPADLRAKGDVGTH